mmetsp:Transcript_1195/g.2332  ORF Transcript_1195/g.2332 Transcript_1195/m.2332 type:complete len:275 (+) Transcript_1195:457-1281(+)
MTLRRARKKRKFTTSNRCNLIIKKNTKPINTRLRRMHCLRAPPVKRAVKIKKRKRRKCCCRPRCTINHVKVKVPAVVVAVADVDAAVMAICVAVAIRVDEDLVMLLAAAVDLVVVVVAAVDMVVVADFFHEDEAHKISIIMTIKINSIKIKINMLAEEMMETHKQIMRHNHKTRLLYNNSSISLLWTRQLVQFQFQFESSLSRLLIFNKNTNNLSVICIMFSLFFFIADDYRLIVIIIIEFISIVQYSLYRKVVAFPFLCFFHRFFPIVSGCIC